MSPAAHVALPLGAEAPIKMMISFGSMVENELDAKLVKDEFEAAPAVASNGLLVAQPEISYAMTAVSLTGAPNVASITLPE
jgi:hypothetical protein